MKRFLVCVLVMVILMGVTMEASAYVEVLSENVVVDTTPFGADFPQNLQYILYAGMQVDVLGWSNGFKVIRLMSNGSPEYGTLYIREDDYNEECKDYCNNDYNEDGKIVKGIVTGNNRVWARYEPRSEYEKNEEKGDVVFHGGDILEINGASVYDEQGNKYYPIRMLNSNGYYVQRYVTAKYVDIILDE